MRQKQRVFSLFLLSPSSRRAWIEIICTAQVCETRLVALLAEGVDRNVFAGIVQAADKVALLAEGVDRNTLRLYGIDLYSMSPSSRRAWIEIARPPSCTVCIAGRPPRGGRG